MGETSWLTYAKKHAAENARYVFTAYAMAILKLQFLAHCRMAGICGTGMKPDDLIGAWACSACHDEIDRRTHNLDNKDARLYHLEGVIRTQAILLKEGKIKS